MENHLYRTSTGAAVEGAHALDEGCEVRADDRVPEREWNDVYGGRRDAWKQKAKAVEDASPAKQCAPTQINTPEQPLLQSLETAPELANRAFIELNGAQVVAGKIPEDAPADKDIEKTIRRWTLNFEQARAFRMVAEHASSGTCTHHVRPVDARAHQFECIGRAVGRRSTCVLWQL